MEPSQEISAANPTPALPPSPPPPESSTSLKLSKIGANFFSASLQTVIPLAAILIILSLAGFIHHSNPVALPASASHSKPTKLKFYNGTASSAAFAPFAPVPAPAPSLYPSFKPQKPQKLNRRFGYGSVPQQTPTAICACIQPIGIIIPMIPIFSGAISLLMVDLALFHGGQIRNFIETFQEANRLRSYGFGFIAVLLPLLPTVVSNPFAMASVLAASVGAVSFGALFGNLFFARVVTTGSIAQMVLVLITLACKHENASASLAAIGFLYSSLSLALIEYGSRRMGETPPLYRSLVK